jgi:hypothetical protein
MIQPLTAADIEAARRQGFNIQFPKPEDTPPKPHRIKAKQRANYGPGVLEQQRKIREELGLRVKPLT